MGEGRPGVAYKLAAGVVRPAMTLAAKRDWAGGEHLPREGGCVVAVNHLSHLDPVAFAHFVHDQGRQVRFLAKAGLFSVPVFGRFLHNAGQIPIERERRSAGDALGTAQDAIRDGACVVIYPEGTITRDPDLWPMAGRTGIARIALATGCPVIPAAQWGAHEVLAPYTKLPKLLPRKTMRIRMGPPVDLSAYDGREQTSALQKEVTATIMEAVTTLLAGIRGEPAPAERFDPRAAGMPMHGNFRKKRRP